MYKLKISKEYNHFTSGHFIVFDEKNREMLHGHNYYVEVVICGELKGNGKLLDVNSVKPVIKQICDELDHKLILAKNCEFLKIVRKNKKVHVQHNEDDFSFPEKDIVFLDINNTTMENLAKYISKELRSRIDLSTMSELQVSVEETKGQSAVYVENIKETK